MKVIGVECAVIGRSPGLPNRFGCRHQRLRAGGDHDPMNFVRATHRSTSRGGFQPRGSTVSAIEIAFWDLAGKAVGVPGSQAARRQRA